MSTRLERRLDWLPGDCDASSIRPWLRGHPAWHYLASLATVERRVRYAVNGDVHIAYTTVGDGPLDLVYAPGIWSNLDVMWEDRRWARFLDRLASFSRLIVFDMRGIGLSDRGAEPPYLESQMDDLRAVLDAAGSERAVVFGGARGAAMSMLFAATYPGRTDALVLYAAAAKTVRDDEYPYGKSPTEQRHFVERFTAEMGTGANLDLQGPSALDDPAFVRWWARFERLVATPGAYRELADILSGLDVRAVLPSIQAPTLILQRIGDRIVPADQARYLADSIPTARLVELPGDDHIPFLGDADAVIDEIEEFVTGTRRVPEIDRVLNSVLFTDIVDSTRRQASMGDEAWRRLIESHHELVRDCLARWRGVENDTAGDGFYATFDGPARAVRCALEIVDRVRGLGIEVRAGVHTGECTIIDGKCGGIAVTTGARISGLAEPSQVLVSRTVRDLVAGSGLKFEDLGEKELKGIPQPWQLFVAQS
jgi:pimeloyl-ACP methyl ester carboxylesterase/class 3 adenylate cyclase